MSAALNRCPGSNLMSRGPSAAKLKPRRESSSWEEESPRSRKAPSSGASPLPSAARGSLASAKFPGTKRKPSPTSALRASARLAASGSRSMATSRPPGMIRLRISRECPPPPKVPSKKTAPGVGWRICIAASKRTGMCCGPLGPEALGTGVAFARDLVGERGVVGGVGFDRLPADLTPDLHQVVDADHNGRALDTGAGAQGGGDEHPALAVELDLVGLGEEPADQVAFGGHGRRADAVLLRHPIPLVGRVDTKAVLRCDGDDGAAGELLAELDRQSQAPLGVEIA